MIPGVHVLYPTFFHIILFMALQYSHYGNISATVTSELSEISPFALFQSSNQPTEIILRASLGFWWNQSKEQVVAEMVSAPSHYIFTYLCLPWHTAQSTHEIAPNRDPQTWDKTCSPRGWKMMFSMALVQINHWRTNPSDQLHWC